MASGGKILQKGQGSAKQDLQLLGSSQTDYVFNVLYKCSQQVGERLMADVLKVLYSQKFVKSNLGHMPIRKFCVTEKHWHEQRIKKKFGKFEKYLECDIMKIETVNVNFAHQVMVELCGNAFDWLNDDCKKKIRILKNYTKKVCQKYGLKEEDLPWEFMHLEKMVKTIYSEVGKEFDKNFKDSLEAIKEVLESTLDNLYPYNENVPSVLPDEETRMLITIQRELKTYYNKLETCNPYLWIRDTLNTEYKKNVSERPYAERIYTPLKTGEAGSKIRLKNILTTTKRQGDEEVIAPILILNGPAGCGKTALCRHLVHCWCSATDTIDTLENIDLVILIENFKTNSLLLKPYLREKLLSSSYSDFSDRQMFSLLRDLDVLWVLDGFHEVTSDSLGIVNEIVEQFSYQRILLTTRDRDPATMSVVVGSHVNYQVVLACPLDDEGQVRIVRSVFRDQLQAEKKIADRVKEFKELHHKGIGRIADHLRYPMTATLYSAYWQETNNMPPTTAADLHQAIYKFSIGKVASHTGIKDPEIMFALHTDFPHLLGLTAWMMLKKEKHIIEEANEIKIREYLTNLIIDPAQAMPTLFSCNTDHSVSPTKVQFSFYSRPQQAYFAARYLASCADSDKTSLIELQKQDLEWRQYPLVLMFIVGQLCTGNSDEHLIQRALSMIRESECHLGDYTYWWNVYQESKGHSIVKTYIANVLHKPHWVLNPVNCVSALKLLSNTPVKLASLKIDIPSNVDPFDIPELLEVMRGLPKALKDRHRKPMEVELHFWRHDEIGCRLPSDQFVQTLQPWGMLVNFTGEIGECGKMVLSRNLRTIRVRVSSPEAVWALSHITERLLDLARVVRVTMALPETCNPAVLPHLSCPHLELNFSEMNTANKKWLISVMKRLGGNQGVWRVSIKTVTLNYTSLLQMMQELSGIISDKLTLGTAEDVADDQLRTLQKSAQFVVNLV